MRWFRINVKFPANDSYCNLYVPLIFFFYHDILAGIAKNY